MSKKRTVKEILRKIDSWKSAEMSTGVYRLFIYLDWKDIPKKYKKFFNKDAKKFWREGGASSVENIEEDINIVINNILLELSKGNIALTFPLIPPIIADIFMLGKGTDRLQANFMTIIRDYLDTMKYDMQFAKINAAIHVGEYIKKLVKAAGVEPNVDIDKVVETIITSDVYELSEDLEKGSVSIMSDVNKALKEYEEREVERKEELSVGTDKKTTQSV